MGTYIQKVLSYEERLRHVSEELRVEKENYKSMVTHVCQLEEKLYKYEDLSPYAKGEAMEGQMNMVHMLLHMKVNHKL